MPNKLKEAIPAEIQTNVDSIFQFAKEHMDPVEDENIEEESVEKENANNEKSEEIEEEEELSFVCSMRDL